MGRRCREGGVRTATKCTRRASGGSEGRPGLPRRPQGCMLARGCRAHRLAGGWCTRGMQGVPSCGEQWLDLRDCRTKEPPLDYFPGGQLRGCRRSTERRSLPAVCVSRTSMTCQRCPLSEPLAFWAVPRPYSTAQAPAARGTSATTRSTHAGTGESGCPGRWPPAPARVGVAVGGECRSAQPRTTAPRLCLAAPRGKLAPLGMLTHAPLATMHCLLADEKVWATPLAQQRVLLLKHSPARSPGYCPLGPAKCCQRRALAGLPSATPGARDRLRFTSGCERR
jgi:hypothetical protein